MDIKKLFAVPANPVGADVSLLLMRLVAGSAMMLHGWGKIQNPFGWMGEGAWAPGIFQALAALSEFGGGLAWIIGLLTPLASMGIGSTMAVAFYSHAVLRGDPFVGRGGSFEKPVLFLCIALVLFAIGPGRFSLDRILFGHRA